jgi:hypothetical protein
MRADDVMGNMRFVPTAGAEGGGGAPSSMLGLSVGGAGGGMKLEAGAPTCSTLFSLTARLLSLKP